MEVVIQDFEMKVSDEVKVIAFDIFDTILCRKINPEMIKRIWAKEIIEKYNLKVTTDTLYKRRIKEERVNRIKNNLKNNSRECDYSAMIYNVYKYLNLNCSYDEFYEYSLQIELRIECKYCYVSPKWIKLIKHLNENYNLKYICISDFYLGKSIIEKLFDNFNILSFFSEIYVSCDYLMTKSDGSLFEYVIMTEKINPNFIMMIGDNKSVDIEMSRKKGFISYHLVPDVEYNKIISSKKCIDFVSNKIPRDNFQYSVFCLYAFIDRLYWNMKEKNINSIFFLAREGELLKKMFDAYLNIFEIKEVSTHYLKVSRRATYLPSIKTINHKLLSNYIGDNKKINITSFLKDMNLDNDIEIQNMFINDEYIDEKELLENEKFINIVLNKSNEQKTYFKAYMDSFDLDLSKSIAMVDIGYKGTIQDNIYNIYEGSITIEGFYMFLEKSAKVSRNNRKIGILYNPISDKNNRRNSYFLNNAILEDILAASHGSTTKYDKVKNKIIPILTEIQTEKETYNNIIKSIQVDLYSNFCDISKMFYDNAIHYNDYKYCFEKLYGKFIFNPTEGEMRAYLNIPHIQNFNIYKVDQSSYGQNGQVSYNKISNILRIIITKGEFIRRQNARWLPAAFYTLGLAKLNILCLKMKPLILSIIEYDYIKRQSKNVINVERGEEDND